MFDPSSSGALSVSSGVTQIFAPDGQSLGAFTLTDPLDAVFLDDSARAAWRYADRSAESLFKGLSRRPGTRLSARSARRILAKCERRLRVDWPDGMRGGGSQLVCCWQIVLQNDSEFSATAVCLELNGEETKNRSACPCGSLPLLLLYP